MLASEEAQRRRGKQYVLGNLYSHDDSFSAISFVLKENVQGLQQASASSNSSTKTEDLEDPLLLENKTEK